MRARPLCCIPQHDWPDDLKTAWAAALAPGVSLRARRPAARWAEATKLHVSRGVGGFLFWVRYNDLSAAALPFPDLVTVDRVATFAEARRAEIRDVSVRSLLVGLKRGMAVMFPDRNWSWIRDLIAAIPDGRAESRRRKQPRIHHSAELRNLGIRLTRLAETEPNLRPLNRAVMFRDGVIIALLAVRPIRRKNAVSLRIGEDLVRQGGRWRIAIPASKTKNHEAYERTVPPIVGKLIDRYVEVYRPILLARGKELRASETKQLWISRQGTPLASNSFACAVCNATGKAFGKSTPPHFFRYSAMTTYALDLPKNVRGGIHVLGNRSLSVAESAYNMAGTVDAAPKLHDAIQAFRRKAKHR